MVCVCDVCVQVNDTLAFSQSQLGQHEGGHASLDGVVVRSYNMQPQAGGQSYQRLLQTRMVAHSLVVMDST